eukprot:1828682-Amphidinium_carterae.1
MAVWVQVVVIQSQSRPLPSSGLGKLLPSHPMYSTLKAEFDKLVGPYLGWPATLLRLVLGLAEVAAGLALLMIIWGEEL